MCRRRDFFFFPLGGGEKSNRATRMAAACTWLGGSDVGRLPHTRWLQLSLDASVSVPLKESCWMHSDKLWCCTDSLDVTLKKGLTKCLDDGNLMLITF